MGWSGSHATGELAESMSERTIYVGIRYIYVALELNMLYSNIFFFQLPCLQFWLLHSLISTVLSITYTIIGILFIFVSYQNHRTISIS